MQAVWRARQDMEFGRHICLCEPLGVRDVLVPEAVGTADDDEGRRQAGR